MPQARGAVVVGRRRMRSTGMRRPRATGEIFRGSHRQVKRHMTSRTPATTSLLKKWISSTQSTQVENIQRK
jgi:hypothetical protein